MIPVLKELHPKAIECLGVLGVLETRVTREEKLELFSGLPTLFRGFWRHDERVVWGQKDYGGVAGSKGKGEPL